MKPMDPAKKARLEAAGWRFGDYADFLGLTAEEVAYIELKLALAAYLRELRLSRQWTQSQVAVLLGSSQSRVAKMEAADRTVSIDLLVRSLLKLGATCEEVGRVIAQAA
jgi:predicted XRE-type DNA-binding protein